MHNAYQPSLDVDIHDYTNLADFDSVGYAPILSAIDQLIDGRIKELFIIGAQGAGKTHLAAAIYDRYTEQGYTAISLSLGAMVAGDANALAGLETFDLVILDDVQAVAGNPEWQEGLFHLINRIRKQGVQLIFLADNPARELNITLLDLVTRLSLTPALHMPDGTDEEDRAAVLASILRHRSWRLPDTLTNHMIQDGPKNAGGMIKVLEQLAPMLTHLSRPKLSKKAINTAKSIIERETLLLEIGDDAYEYHQKENA